MVPHSNWSKCSKQHGIKTHLDTNGWRMGRKLFWRSSLTRWSHEQILNRNLWSLYHNLWTKSSSLYPEFWWLLLLHSLQASLSCPYRLCLTPLLCLHFTYISAHPSFHYKCPLFSLSTVRSLRMRTMSQSPWSPAPSTVLSTFHLLTLYPNYSYCCPPLRERGFFYQQGLSHLCKPKPVVYDQTSRERAYQMLGAVPFHHF